MWFINVHSILKMTFLFICATKGHSFREFLNEYTKYASSINKYILS